MIFSIVSFDACPTMMEKCHPPAPVPIKRHDPTPTSVICHQSGRTGSFRELLSWGKVSSFENKHLSVFWTVRFDSESNVLRHLCSNRRQLHEGEMVSEGLSVTLLEFLLGSLAASWSSLSINGSKRCLILWSIMQHSRCKQSVVVEDLSWNNIFFLHFLLSINLLCGSFKKTQVKLIWHLNYVFILYLKLYILLLQYESMQT